MFPANGDGNMPGKRLRGRTTMTDPRRRIDRAIQKVEDRQHGTGAGDLITALTYAIPLLAVGYALSWLLS